MRRLYEILPLRFAQGQNDEKRKMEQNRDNSDYFFQNMKLRKNNYAFIDSQNLNLAIRELGWALDLKRFRKYLEDKYAVAKAFIFIGYLATNESLYTSLQKYGYILIFKPTLLLADGSVKGNIEYLKKQGKLEKLIIPNRYKFSSLLRKFASDSAYMNNLSEKLGYK